MPYPKQMTNRSQQSEKDDAKTLRILKKKNEPMSFNAILEAADKETYRKLNVLRGRVLRSLKRLEKKGSIRRGELEDKVLYDTA